MTWEARTIARHELPAYEERLRRNANLNVVTVDTPTDVVILRELGGSTDKAGSSLVLGPREVIYGEEERAQLEGRGKTATVGAGVAEVERTEEAAIGEGPEEAEPQRKSRR